MSTVCQCHTCLSSLFNCATCQQSVNVILVCLHSSTVQHVNSLSMSYLFVFNCTRAAPFLSSKEMEFSAFIMLYVMSQISRDDNALFVSTWLTSKQQINTDWPSARLSHGLLVTRHLLVKQTHLTPNISGGVDPQAWHFVARFVWNHFTSQNASDPIKSKDLNDDREYPTLCTHK